MSLSFRMTGRGVPPPGGGSDQGTHLGFVPPKCSLGFVPPKRHSEDLSGSFRHPPTLKLRRARNPSFVMPALVAGSRSLRIAELHDRFDAEKHADYAGGRVSRKVSKPAAAPGTLV